MKMNPNISYHPLTATPFKRNTSYTELNSCKELRPYIRCYWGTDGSFARKGKDSAPEIVIPDTCVDIIYYINGTTCEISGGFCGINDHSFRLPGESGTDCTVDIFAIRFYAWSAYAFAEDSLEATMNGYLETASIFGGLDKVIRSKLPELRTLRERAVFAEQLLLKKLSDVKENKVVDSTIQNILVNRGCLAVSDLAKKAFVSTRQLERLIHEYVGITPKKLSNLIRYQLLWRDIVCERNFDVLYAVQKYGYTDQAHMLREFKRYHSMDMQRARVLAFHDVGNIQDISGGL